MMRFHALLLLTAAVVFSACSDKGGESEVDVQLASGTPKNYTVYADKTSCTPSEGISFTTTGPWRASVEESRAVMSDGDSVSWVNISPDHGDAAGEYTILIQLAVNTTGQNRKATITIECGSTKITIGVEQRGKTEEGKVPDAPAPAASKFVSRIDETISYWEGCDDRFNTETYIFKYDDRNRVVELTMTLGKDDDVEYERICQLDYSTANRIRIDACSNYGLDGTPSCYIAVLDESGRISRIENTTSQDNFRCYFTYNAEGRLSRQDWSDEYGNKGYRAFDYKEGVMSGVTIKGEEEDVSETELEKQFGSVKNDMLNIDPNMIFMGGLLYDTQFNGYDALNPLDCLALLRLTGRGSDRCLERYDGGDEAVSDRMAGGYPEPNVVIHHVSEYCEYEWNESLRYTLNDDESVSSISQEENCKKIHYEYDIVSGNELWDSRRPELGYKYSKTNQTRSTIGTGKNLYTRKFTYR